MSTLGVNDQFTTMGQVTDILYNIIVIKENRENILCISCYTSDIRVVIITLENIN